MSQRNDLTIDEVVRDPMIRMLMKADRVDPRSFEAMLRTLADEQADRRNAPRRPLQDFGFLEDSGSTRSRRLSRVAKAFGRARASGEACISW
ncbi:hypothetical protein NKH10_01520 [Mesorhizobium sp. M1340]|uniref:hypothetical protein n=1 Tax=unclassified Mesorhizobium TaxID=325217 RepID=UPI003339E36F